MTNDPIPDKRELDTREADRTVDDNSDRYANDGDLHELIASIRAEVAELKARILSAEVPGTLADPMVHRREERSAERPMNRRLLIKSAGAAALGVAGAVAWSAEHGSPAAAATGDPIIAGQETDATDTTILTSTDTSDGVPGFLVLIGDLLDGQPWNNAAVSGQVFVVDGSGPAQFGVAGNSNRGAGAMFSDFGSAAGSGSSAIRLAANFAQVRFDTSELSPPDPTSNTMARLAGELVFDDSNQLWLCVGDGSPGTWKKLTGPTTLGQLTLMDQPARIYDSRPGYTPLNVTKAPLGIDEARGISALVGQHVPLGATAILCNITVVNTSKNGWVSAYPANTPFPGTSTLNWFQAGSVVANFAVVKLDPSGFFTLQCGGGGQTDVVVDVTGYYAD